MKLSLLSSLLAATLVVGAQGNCSSKKRRNPCVNAGCKWSGGRCTAKNPPPAPAPVPAPIPAPVPAPIPAPTVTPCSSRNGGNCENGDGMCLKVKGDCQDVNGGSGVENDSCEAMLTLDSDGDYFYADIPGKGCASGVLCDVAGAFNSDMVDVPIQGTCKSEECMGKKVPGNCNGNNPNDPTCVATTERVTICHRTCSAKNPWVRITIDEDAWDGEGCGHKQHDVRDECSNKAPWTEWGVNRRDYLIKRHGTRDQVAAKLGGKTADIKAYWKKWEHACPYVRNGACCDWDDPENPCCGDAPVEPVVPAQAQCPYQTLDFNNLVNPMARWYGQDSVLKAGDFLYDQLWYTHGVKVSARVRWNSHRDDSQPYIPKYERGGSGWIDSKMEQDRDLPSSGGAVMLFDTLRPTYSSDSRYHQPLCPNANGKGDPDLGAPNGQCEGGGPGHGPGGIPFDPDTNMANPWANCEELGLVGIIQESDDGCPDDTGKGGFITFEFRQPIEFLKLASLLDIDEGNTPNIKVYYNGGSTTKVFDTTATGDNGLFPLEFDTHSIKEVTMIDIEYWGSGSINSLVYPYCPETPTPKIEIKKFAGPPGMCSATGKAGMEDNMYTLPSSSDSWAYCYEISIPSDSDECLYDIDMNDFAEIGGTSGWQNVKTGAETMCPGDKVYIPGTTKPGDMAPEGMFDAKVRGYGYYSGIQVVDEDPAAVEVYEEVPAQAQCPYQTLDFNNLVNPMARWYGQDSVLKAGDFLYDQLWYTHGVKVSARVRWNSHRDDSQPYIPKYERGGSGWIDSKMEQNRNQPSSGGAVMLFDTLRPTYSSDPRYHQPLCPNVNGKGDPDLGAPNGQCEGGGPGHGPGGIPFDPDTNMANPWANCEELGLVGIIQESDDGCPDDTGKGGFITFEFRQPIEFLKLASLLDIDEGNTPNIKVYYNGGSTTKVFDTTATGDNGLFPLEFDTHSIKEVTMIDIEYWGSGSINSLVYPYCPETPTPKIEIKKFAGPPGMCSATGKAGMEDNMYTLPSSSDSWAYCYEISIPSDSDECLYDIDMNDFAEIGGTSGWQNVKTGAETMCPGDKVYIPGTTKPGDMAPEGMFDAKVRGYGYYSGIQVVDEDPAAVEVYEEVPAQAQCPYQTLDFNNLVNPMARWYGQDSVLKAGDFLYDQLWYTHGVKVSARVRWNSHRDDSQPYIPKYERGGSGWIDSKMEQNRNQPSSGGAVMLFDTLRPTYSSDPRYHQPLCPNVNGKGDPDLGAPNGQCEGGGPGHGPGGIPFDPDTNMANPWANCEELGLVGIIQESDDGCPDDTGKGGFITFEFRQPIEFLKLASLLDIDEGNTPNIKVYYNGGSTTKVFDTAATGDNGLFPLEFDTHSIKEVTMIDIEYWGSGSINSLVYPYCPETPTPKIEIKKFAGPPGMCSATGKAGMEDNMYTLPSSSDSWAYCYEISIPSDSDECLYDIDMNDFAEIGGTSGWQNVKTGAETMCPGDKVYIPGTTKPGDMAPEGMIDAKVRGYGYYSGIKVTDEDPAAVEVEEEIITPPPTAAPTVCFDRGETADTICPSSASSAISTIGIKSDNDQIVPDGLVPSSIFYNLEFTGTAAAPEVSFKVDNPFDFDVNMMIQYHERPSGSSGFALDPACEGRLDEPGCNPSSESIKAGCSQRSLDGTPFTMVSIFFISDNAVLGAGGSNVHPFGCCPIPDADANKPIIEYTFKIMCECPSTARKLRGVAGNESIA